MSRLIMENMWQEPYVISGGLIPRSLLLREIETIPPIKYIRLLEQKRDVLEKLVAKFDELNKRGGDIDEIDDTHPVVDFILKRFFNFKFTDGITQGKCRYDFFARSGTDSGIIVEVKNYPYRDLTNAPGSKSLDLHDGKTERESAPQQVCRYIQTHRDAQKGAPDLAILTNARDWRLQDSQGNFFEIDLDSLVRYILSFIDCDFERITKDQETALRKLAFTFSLFGTNSKSRRSLIESANLTWYESYSTFRSRLSHTLAVIDSKCRSEKDKLNAKSALLWTIFIRSLEDLGVLDATLKEISSA